MAERTRNPVKTVAKYRYTRGRKALILASLGQYPSAGPYANVTGMRQRYWGTHAPILKVGVYIYKVPQSIYNEF